MKKVKLGFVLWWLLKRHLAKVEYLDHEATDCCIGLLRGETR
jgi:hypothetical protein